MDKVVNILLLTIIFVFDPLAIALVIAANVAFDKLKKKYKENIYGEEVEIDGDPPFIPDTPISKSIEEKATEEERKILNRSDISAWKKNKIKKEISKRKDEDDNLIIKY